MTDTPEDSLRRGLDNRRRVLGDEWVEQSIARANALNAEIQMVRMRCSREKPWV